MDPFLASRTEKTPGLRVPVAELRSSSRGAAPRLLSRVLHNFLTKLRTCFCLVGSISSLYKGLRLGALRQASACFEESALGSHLWALALSSLVRLSETSHALQISPKPFRAPDSEAVCFRGWLWPSGKF